MNPHAELTHLAGFDWAGDHHDITIIDAQGKPVAGFQIENTAAGWRQWKEAIGSYPSLGVAIETSFGMVVEQELRILCRDEVALTEERTALISQLRQALREYYPAALEAFADWTAAHAWASAERFPGADALPRAGKRRWEKFLHTHKHKSTGHCVWAKSYYNALREKGKTHAQALRCLGQRWIKIIWKMWQTHTPYNAELHLKNQICHGSWVLKHQPA